MVSSPHRYKAEYNFYPIHNNFVLETKKMFFGPHTMRLTLDAATFLCMKGIYETYEEFTIIRLYMSKEKPFLLPFYVFDKFFAEKLC